MNRLVLIGVLVSIALIVVVLSLIRTRRLQERHAIIWLVAAAVIVIVGVSSTVLSTLADALGIAYPPSALFLVVVAFLGVALLDCVVTISRLTDRVRTLAQQLAILEEKIATLNGNSDDSAAVARDDQAGGPVAGPPVAGAPTRSSGPESDAG
jgi:hypothetical protein